MFKLLGFVLSLFGLAFVASLVADKLGYDWGFSSYLYQEPYTKTLVTEAAKTIGNDAKHEQKYAEQDWKNGETDEQYKARVRAQVARVENFEQFKNDPMREDCIMNPDGVLQSKDVVTMDVQASCPAGAKPEIYRGREVMLVEVQFTTAAGRELPLPKFEDEFGVELKVCDPATKRCYFKGHVNYVHDVAGDAVRLTLKKVMP